MDDGAKRETAGAHGDFPTVDLLVPTRNRHDCLRRSLPSWRATGTRILLCDQSPTPFAATGVRVLHRPDIAGLPAARNALLAASDAEIVVFLDDDCEIAADFVSQVQRLARRETAVVAWGPVVEQRGRWTRRAHRVVHLGAFHDVRRLVSGRGDQPTNALFGCCFAVRRAAAAQVGFDARRPGYALGEDFDFFGRLTRAHGRVRFARGLTAIHRRDGEDRATPFARGLAKGAFLSWTARRHGQGNPATLVHLLLALVGAASGQGQEPAAWRGVLAGWWGADGHGRVKKRSAR
jgi:GT2 family glycosyltransferase